MKKNLMILLCVLVINCIISPIYGKVQGFEETHKKNYGKDTWHTYTHTESGLQVIWIENKDVNKSFTIGVKTPTTNDTGVNHIIEHTLFTGSKNFPSPSVFFDASEAYPNTYMNALTSGDMTIFPFSTPYLSCFNKLRNIYLDAIFEPNLLREPYGFYEESFHYVPSEQRCGGVVYNEMKGAYESLERAVFRTLRESIYAGSHYGFDSGGAPNAIPTLTYEAFVDTYKQFYYPGNMRVIVYGDVPIEETLEQIVPYVKNKPKKESFNLMVEGIETKDQVLKKNLPNISNKGCIVKAFILDEEVSASELQKLDLWMSAYLMSSQCYFQTQLQKLGIRVQWMRDNDVPFPLYAMVVGDVPVEKMDACSRLMDKILEETSKHQGKNIFLEQDILKEAKWAQDKQDTSNNRGIAIAQSILDGWAHEREEDQYYRLMTELTQMKFLDNDISDLFFKKAQRCTLSLLPETYEIEVPETLSKMNGNEWEKIYEDIQKWQARKAFLEPIDLKELLIEVEQIPIIKQRKNYWEMETRVGTTLARSTLYLNTSHIQQNQLPYLYLYSYFFEESAKDITPYCGKLSTQCTAYPTKEGYWPCFKLSFVTDTRENQHGILFNEARSYLLNRPESWYKQKLVEFTMGMKGNQQNNPLGALTQLTIGQNDKRGAYLYQQTYPLYAFCQKLIQEKTLDWVQEVKAIDRELYHTGGTILATAIPEKGQNAYAKSWEKVINSWCKKPNNMGNYEFQIPKGNYVISHDTNVDYCYMNLYKSEGVQGSDYLLAAYLTKHYLNPQIRVKMGAYGAGCQVYDLKTMGIYTYRDPDYRNSLSIIQKSGKCLKENIDHRELSYSKAEALNRVHTQYRLLGTPFEKSAVMEHLILWGKSPKEIIKMQKDIILSTPEDILEKQDDFEKIVNKGIIATMTQKKCNDGQKLTIFHY